MKEGEGGGAESTEHNRTGLQQVQWELDNIDAHTHTQIQRRTMPRTQTDQIQNVCTGPATRWICMFKNTARAKTTDRQSNRKRMYQCVACLYYRFGITIIAHSYFYSRSHLIRTWARCVGYGWFYCLLFVVALEGTIESR